MTELVEKYLILLEQFRNLSDEEREEFLENSELGSLWYKMTEEEIYFIDKKFADEYCAKYGHNLDEPEYINFTCLTCGSHIPYNIKN